MLVQEERSPTSVFAKILLLAYLSLAPFPSGLEENQAIATMPEAVSAYRRSRAEADRLRRVLHQINEKTHD